MTEGRRSGLASDRGTVGRILRRERELRQLSLEEVAQATRIPVRTLRLLEADQVSELPSDVFVRGFLKAYARTLGLDPDPLLARHDRASQATPTVPTPIAAMTPERGRRFGVAIAVVILLILFTLALSIVLRPRRRDIPIELSTTSVVAPEIGCYPADRCAPPSHERSCSDRSTTATPTGSSRC